MTIEVIVNIYRNKFNQLLRWAGAICLLVIFLCNANTNYLSDEYTGNISEEYERVSEKVTANPETHTRPHYSRFKKRYYIASRKYIFDHFFNNAFTSSFTGRAYLSEVITQKLCLVLSVVPKPSYYIFLFLHAVF